MNKAALNQKKAEEVDRRRPKGQLQQDAGVRAANVMDWIS